MKSNTNISEDARSKSVNDISPKFGILGIETSYDDCAACIVNAKGEFLTENISVRISQELGLDPIQGGNGH